ncbi:MAG TPA: hypothetical protein VKX16_08665 [Chloroflexota bacterium]|nr:hypothetical protein [Chloroflexota bacterium]
MSRNTRTLVLSLFVLAGTFGARPSPSAGAAAATASTDVRLLSAASAMSGHSAVRAVTHWLLRHAAVRSVARGKDGHTLTVRFRDGVEGDIVPRDVHTIGIRSGVFGRRVRPLARSASPGGARAAVWEPFATELGLGPYAGQPEVSALQSAGFQVDQAYDASVSIELFTTLSQYNVVYMHTHSGVDASGRGLVASGEPANGDPGVQQYLADGTVVIAGVAGSSQLYYGITSSFIVTHVGRFPGNALLFINGCELLASNDFWQALAQQGAGVLISWDHLGSAQDDYLSAAVFFNQMTGGLSVAQAVAGTLAAGYGTSVYQGQKATLGFQGNGAVTLAEAAGGGSGGATGTPIPSPTVPPATTPPTNTPVPTSTPVPTRPPVVPRLGLRSLVKPGSQQVLDLQFVPNARVHVLVAFPNGDAKQGDVTTDTAGDARFSFRQLGSEITRSDNSATVTIQSLDGATPVNASGQYRIEFGHIDVSVQPRTQRAGHAVTVWVHARARSTVMVVIGRNAPLHGLTGSRGWARLHYRLPASMHRHQSVVVRGLTTVGKRTYRTKTTLTVA